MINNRFIPIILSTTLAVSMLFVPLSSMPVFAAEETTEMASETTEITSNTETIEYGSDGVINQDKDDSEEPLVVMPDESDTAEIQENIVTNEADAVIDAQDDINVETQINQEEILDDDISEDLSNETSDNPKEIYAPQTADDIVFDDEKASETENEAGEAVSDNQTVTDENTNEDTLIPISECFIDELASLTYTGKALTESITIKNGEDVLVANTDYTVAYENNINAGTAKVIITGQGKYTGTVEKTFKIAPIKVTPTVTISNKTLTYNGQNRTPSVSVKYGNVVLKRDQDYTVRYASKCSNVGTYNAVVTLKGNYSGSNKAQYTILPKGTSIYNVVGSKDHFDVKWSKQTTQVAGYQIQYSQSSSFVSGNKTVTVTNNTVNTKTIKKPASGKEYYVRVRTFMTSGGKRYYSLWSKVVSTVVKRTLNSKQTIILYDTESEKIASSWKSSYSFSFKITNRMTVMIPLSIKLHQNSRVSKGGIKVTLKNAQGKVYQDDSINLKNLDSFNTYETWLYNDNGILLAPGEYTFTIKNTSDCDLSVMTHLKSVINKLKKSMDYAGDKAASEIQSKRDGALKKKEQCEEELTTVIEQFEYYQSEKEKYAALLRANEETAAAQKRREQLNTVIRNLENQVERDKKALVSVFSKNSFAFFSLPLLKQVVKLLDTASEETESVPEMTAAAIDYILKRGVCICGTCISEGSAAEKHLLVERKKQPPESIGSLVRRYREQAMDYISSSDDYYNSIESRIVTLRNNQRELGLRIDEKASLEHSLKGAKDVSILETSYQDANRRMKSFDRDRTRLQETIGACKKDIDNYEKALEKLGKANKKNIKIALNIEYAQAVCDWVAEAYNKRENSVRSKLEEKVNANFASMYHGSRTIMIDEKYRVKYIDVTTEESDGLKAVKSFAFVSGLVDLAKEALSTGEDDAANIGPQYYPLVMDAPFSNVDETHIQNISKILPASAEQVIIAVMKKDWEPASAIMEPVVGKTYVIEKDIDQEGKEIDTMTHIRVGA